MSDRDPEDYPDRCDSPSVIGKACRWMDRDHRAISILRSPVFPGDAMAYGPMAEE